MLHSTIKTCNRSVQDNRIALMNELEYLAEKHTDESILVYTFRVMVNTFPKCVANPQTSMFALVDNIYLDHWASIHGFAVKRSKLGHGSTCQADYELHKL